MSEQLLSLAQAHQLQQSTPGSAAEEAAICDANAVAREGVIAHLPQALEKQIDLGWRDARGEDVDDADGDELQPGTFVAPVKASALGLHEVLSNLVHNAIAYTPHGGRVSVSAHVSNEQTLNPQVQLLVQDDGPGIAPEDRERAFQRFERLQPTSGGATVPGSGLGLAIARTYLQPMQGRIELLDGEGGKGLTVRVTLPLAK
ncbi:Adaptive-response sensory-kinase SasA [bioreactor metagenome]|uniref:histidine kinase n=1 Tax=bioreactor metagenome TaxID=1076179 RepID=A0A645HWW8_9ZZZZ